MRLIRVAPLVAVLACALAAPSLACSSRPYGAVSDRIEMADDASRTGDFALAAFYAGEAVDAAAHESTQIRECAGKYARIKLVQMEARETLIAREGRTPETVARALAIDPVFTNFNCP